MCGIGGILLKPNAQLPDLRARLERMAGAMSHRGPDDGGTFVSQDGRLGVASRRLAILDLSPAGHMPMFSPDERVGIVYNGEVYNAPQLRHELKAQGHVFRSQTDTEVILRGYQTWGRDVVTRLNGMFAFAAFSLQPNGEVRELLLARDHLGIKPLYLARVDAGLVWASELQTLQATGLMSREADSCAVRSFLLTGSVPAPMTIYRQARALEPATRLTLTPQNLDAQPETFWRLPDEIAPENISLEDATAQIRRLLQDAVQRQIVSDAPLGAFLSGGLDSSAVVGLMRQATSGPIRTCSIAFEESGYSEARYARDVAQRVGAEHFERVITAQDAAHELPCILRAMDQPTVDGVNTYFVSQTARQAGLTVALSGLGGDELFGGYANTFEGGPQLLRAMRIASRFPGGRRLTRAGLNVVPGRHRFERLRDALAFAPTRAAAYLSRRGLYAPTQADALLSPDFNHDFDLVGHVQARAGSENSPFAWTSRAELRTYTHHQLLRDTDAMSMAHSLEVRVPLLDTVLVEAALRLPMRVKTQGDGPKPLLCRAVADVLPDSVRDRRDKQGFTFPFALWLRGDLRQTARDAAECAVSRGWLQSSAVAQAFDDFAQGRLHWSRVWALAALGGFE